MLVARAGKQPEHHSSGRPCLARVYSIEQIQNLTLSAKTSSLFEVITLERKCATVKMPEIFWPQILAVSFLMQICHHFPTQSNALRMINLDAPQMALEGETIQLSCSYSLVTPSVRASAHDNKLATGSHLPDRSLELETVYAVKWYRDESEFFRYLTRDWPHKQSFAVDGLNIDVEKSDNQTVVLRDVSLKTSGQFRCEVSTDAPSFLTESIERRLLIYHLPSEGPLVEHLNPGPSRKHHLGAQLNFRCRTKESKPAARIDWIINETLNLTAIDNLPTDSYGKPLVELSTRRTVSLPLSSSEHKNPRSVSGSILSRSGPKDEGSNKFVYFVGGQVGAQQPSRESAPARALLSAYALEDLDGISTGHSARISIALAADSLHQLLESSISWLNLTVDTNLLQYLSSKAAMADRLAPLDVTWTTRKTVGASNKFLASLNQTSRGNALAKSRPQIGTLIGSHQRNGPLAGHQGGRLSLRIRCVARVMHLSLSDDIRLQLINKTQQQIDLETSDNVIRNKMTLGQGNLGSKPLASFTMYAISLLVLVWIARESLKV